MPGRLEGGYATCMFAAGRLTQAEDRAEGAVTFQTYKTYMKSGGGK